MSYDILKNLGLDRADTGSPDFLRMLERMQREAWESLQRDDHSPCNDPVMSGTLGQ